MSRDHPGGDTHEEVEQRALGFSMPDRRAFLAGAVGGLMSACGWDGGSLVRPKLLAFSHVNDWLGAALFSDRHLAPTYDPSQQSTSFPAYHVSRMTPTLTNPGSWRLEVGGLVQRPLTLTLGDLRSPSGTTYTVKHHCVEGWSAIATWTGLPLRDVAEMAGVLPEARYVRFDSFDASYYNGWDLESALHPQTLLAYGFNGADLNAARGAPLRVYAPHKLGYKLTKYLTRITFTDERPGGYWEDQGYPWYGGI
ncbi:MAG: molybdopterin-dependent oxidoreductase [Gemmatimonadota bacterium]|jgi:DMSO/TMAO reductase YedYZ molybdopterin-dependent catalytic subunit